MPVPMNQVCSRLSSKNFPHLRTSQLHLSYITAPPIFDAFLNTQDCYQVSSKFQYSSDTLQGLTDQYQYCIDASAIWQRQQTSNKGQKWLQIAIKTLRQNPVKKFNVDKVTWKSGLAPTQPLEENLHDPKLPRDDNNRLASSENGGQVGFIGREISVLRPKVLIWYFPAILGSSSN